MKKSISSVITLTLICAIIVALLGIVNEITAPIIKIAEDKKANEALLVVFPNGNGFEEMSMDGLTLPSTITGVYKEGNGGYVFKMNTTGYSSGLQLMCGVDNTGTVVGATCLASQETLGEEKTYGDKVVSKTIADIDAVDTVSGATRTTTAYRNAVKDALNAFVIVNGGTVDLRSPEEILMDNVLSYASTTSATPNRWTIVEDLGDSVDEVFFVNNDIVLRAGETFAGISESGSVIKNDTAITDEEVVAIAEKIKNTCKYDLELSAVADISDRITDVYATETGYVVTVKGAGFGINGPSEFAPSGKYMVIRVAIAKSDLRILSATTVEQYETDGFGAACAELPYQLSYAGKTAETLDTVDAISGATFTSKGYKYAVSVALDAAKALKEAGK